MNEQQEDTEFTIIKMIIVAVVFIALVAIAAMFVDELNDGVGERNCVEKLEMASDDGYDHCDL